MVPEHKSGNIVVGSSSGDFANKVENRYLA
jgi:hypothetical protein